MSTTRPELWSLPEVRLADHWRTCGTSYGSYHRHREGCPYLVIADQVVIAAMRRNRRATTT